MRKIILSLIILFCTNLTAQNFNGNYISSKTSFKHLTDDKLNYIEDNLFNISITVNEDGGYIICQDQRIPDKLLTYKITEDKIVLGEGVFIYKHCIKEHLGNNSYSTLTLYLDKENHLNLMISDPVSSQVFKNLEKK